VLAFGVVRYVDIKFLREFAFNPFVDTSTVLTFFYFRCIYVALYYCRNYTLKNWSIYESNCSRLGCDNEQWCGRMPVFRRTSPLPSSSLHPEDSRVLRNVVILPHHYTASQPLHHRETSSLPFTVLASLKAGYVKREQERIQSQAFFTSVLFVLLS